MGANPLAGMLTALVLLTLGAAVAWYAKQRRSKTATNDQSDAATRFPNRAEKLALIGWIAVAIVIALVA